ncbi:hypothetical protein F4680DRAFT_401281 [Xylaria scruposa]|nr:hypothetical protein F4680DRAFT_401281 [Xylaria scruposa]
MPGLDKKSIAEDGGIIEVQVFRCKGRKRIALELDPYRNQERYGITSPSGGLVDNPEDATYYNYYLIDAKDSPYATFCFHYRSMKYLKQLNLIPQLDMSPVCRSSLDTRREPPSEKSRSQSSSPVARRFTFNGTTLESQVFDDNFGIIEDEVSRTETNAQEEYFLKTPPELSSSSWRSADAKATSQAPEELSGEAQQRPLPEIPNVQIRPTSASSLRSNCPSLTPSLRLYVESDDFENEEIRLSTAQPMLISSESMQALELVDTGAEEGASFSDYASSPGSTEASRSPRLPSPRGYIPTTGSVLERHLTQYDSPIARSSPPQTQNLPSSETDEPLATSQIKPRTVSLNLTEAEWLRHSPSPLQRKEKRERLWSPQPRQCIDEAVGVSDNDGRRDDRNMEHHAEAIGRAPMGNWI